MSRSFRTGWEFEMWLASFAKNLSRRLGIANPVFIRSKRSADTSGPVRITETPPRPSLPLPSALHRRAVRVCNRKPEAVAQYLKTHAALFRER